MALTEKLIAIANAIRGKTGKTDEMTLDQMAVEIAGIQAGGGQWSTDDIATGAEPTGELTLNQLAIAEYAFYGRSGITKVTANNCGFSQYAFSKCTGITEVEANSCTSGMNYHFSNCTALKKAKWGVGGTGGGSFNGCTNLEMIDCGENFTYIGVNFAVSCKNLKTLILRKPNSPVNFANPNALNGTPFAANGEGGTAYVPAALIGAYQQATNWSTLYAAGTCNFVAIEGSAYE